MTGPLGLKPFAPFGTGVVVVTTTLAPDLASAIADRLARAAIVGLNSFHKDEADEISASEMPYLIFSLNRGTTLRTDSHNNWYDHRVRFTVYARDADVANILISKVWDAIRDQPYDFAGGFSIPLFKVDHSEGKDRGRSTKNQLIYKAAIEVQARVCRPANLY